MHSAVEDCQKTDIEWLCSRAENNWSVISATLWQGKSRICQTYVVLRMVLLLVLCKYNLFGSTVKSSLIPRHLLYSLVNFNRHGHWMQH